MLVIPRLWWKFATFMKDKWIGGNQRFWRQPHDFYEKKLQCIAFPGEFPSNWSWTHGPWQAVLLIVDLICVDAGCRPLWVWEAHVFEVGHLILKLYSVWEKKMLRRHLAAFFHIFPGMICKNWFVLPSQGVLDAWWPVDRMSMRNSRPLSRTWWTSIPQTWVICIVKYDKLKLAVSSKWRSQMDWFLVHSRYISYLV